MRYVARRTPEGSKLGVVLDEDILDLTAAAVRPEQPGLPSLARDVFGRDASIAMRRLERRLAAEPRLRERLAAAGALVPMATAELGPPIDDPSLLLAIGLNYHDHLREMGAPVPAAPYSFTKNRASIVGPRDPIVLPASNPNQVDLEGELVIVMGSPCHGVSEEEAAACIGGYTIANDVSARDWVEAVFRQSGIMEPIAAWEVNLLGKQFPTFCPLGPYLVTSDDIPDVLNLKLTSRVNGETFQSSNTSELIFSPAKIVSYYSRFYRFEPGDLILTGTCSGVGFSRNPKVFLVPGDLVEVEIESLGALANRVVAA